MNRTALACSVLLVAIVGLFWCLPENGSAPVRQANEDVDRITISEPAAIVDGGWPGRSLAPVTRPLRVAVVEEDGGVPVANASVLVARVAIPTRLHREAVGVSMAGVTGQDGAIDLDISEGSPVAIAATRRGAYAEWRCEPGEPWPREINLSLSRTRMPALRLQDASGSPASGMLVDLGSRTNTTWSGTTTADGWLFPELPPGDEQVVLRARMPGFGFSGPVPVDVESSTVTVPDFGFLDIAGPGEFSVAVVAAMDDGEFGPSHQQIVNGSCRIKVAAGSHLYRVRAWGSLPWSAHRQVIAPERRLVSREVVFSVAMQEITGSTDLTGNVLGMLLSSDGAHWLGEVPVQAGRFRRKVVAGEHPATLVLLTSSSCATAAFADVQGPTIDLGWLPASPRPVLGKLQLPAEHRDVVKLSLSGCLLDSGREVTIANSGALVWRNDSPEYMTLLGLPGVSAARVVPSFEGHTADPAFALLHDGVTVPIRFLPGMTVIVHLTGLPKPAATWYLRHADGTLHSSTSMRREEGGQRRVFSRLPAGVYTVHYPDRNVTSEPIEVRPGVDLEVHATVQ